ncbi:MAG: Asp-tRNA(Asn)/Glu-tRNA(Gln) amidotransferase subunit GatB, partial [Elusimicrobia bacterium]|nr:Asp-tRNA(Asn)/Glu-tRNA(Gln) amidotransferase subunit GatB [Elusimicrobiota bacterium]
VDFNRAGTPLVEIVSEPDIRSSDEAYAYLTALKEILQYAGVSGCNMEKGEMRCDANVSLRPAGTEKFGTRAEIKNLNSFHNVKLALDYEFARQAEILDSGGRVVQETRLWDAERGATASMRSKEEAHDYRYFPDPDLLPLHADAAWVERVKASVPELPAQRRARLAAEFGLSDYDAEVLSADKDLGDYFLAAKPEKAFAKTLSNLMTSELLARLNAENLPKAQAQAKIKPGILADLARVVAEGKISSKIAKEVFARLWDGKMAGLDAEGGIMAAIEKQGLAQVSDEGQIKAWIQEALAGNPKAAEDLRGGKERAAGSIVGAVMKLSKGKANPALVNRLIKEAVKA